MTGVDEQLAWWEQRLTALRFPLALVLPHARVGARLVPDADGASALAGVPRMPSDWTWPVWRERPLQYIAHISLPALAAVLPDCLPANGTLHLFADALGDGSGVDSEDAGSFAAYIADGDTTFPTPHAEHPDLGEIELEFPERRMALVPELVLPAPFADVVTGLPDEQYEGYWDLFDEFNEEFFDDVGRHRICGLPDIIQNPMEPECQPAAADWRLLAQIDTDEELGLFWGDTGCIYWWLREPDFRTGRVERSWGFVQTM